MDPSGGIGAYRRGGCATAARGCCCELDHGEGGSDGYVIVSPIIAPPASNA